MLKKLHKIIGLSVCIIIIHLAVTGIILMYPHTFRLHDTYFTSNFIYSLYDMHNPSEVKALESGNDLGLVSSKIIVSDMVLETNIKDIISLLKKHTLFTKVDGLDQANQIQKGCCILSLQMI